MFRDINFMKKVQFLRLFLLMFGATLFLYSCDSTKPMPTEKDDKIILRKVYYDGKDLVEDTAKIENPFEIINLGTVLLFYGDPFEIDSQQNIWVKKTLVEDKNYIWNLSKKSEDSVWLKEHVWKTKW